MTKPKEPAVCRGCGMQLKGTAYMYGGQAFHPDTGKQCKINFYGGYVCCEECDRKASMVMENTMPGSGGAGRYLSSFAEDRLRKNWSQP